MHHLRRPPPPPSLPNTPRNTPIAFTSTPVPGDPQGEGGIRTEREGVLQDQPVTWLHAFSSRRPRSQIGCPHPSLWPRRASLTLQNAQPGRGIAPSQSKRQLLMDLLLHQNQGFQIARGPVAAHERGLEGPSMQTSRRREGCFIQGGQRSGPQPSWIQGCCSRLRRVVHAGEGGHPPAAGPMQPQCQPLLLCQAQVGLRACATSWGTAQQVS